MDERGWNTRIDRMIGKANFECPAASYAQGLLKAIGIPRCVSRCRTAKTSMPTWSRTVASAAKPRSVRVEQEMPFDEAKLRQGDVHRVLPGAGSRGPSEQIAGIQQVDAVIVADVPVRMFASIRMAMYG